MKRLTMILGIFTLFFGACPAWADWSTPVNLGPGVNTNLYEFAPSLSVTQDTLYFTRMPFDNDCDIYMSVFRGGVWDTAVRLSDSINSTTYQETAPFISYDGSRLYFTKCPVLGSAFYIYYSEKQNGIWQGAKRFEAAFNNDGYHNSWPCLTHDGRRFYFYSYIRPGGKGVGDLWYSDYDTVTQAWGLPVNLGDSINTPDWEFCPTLSWDDRTLYFQSDRAPTLKADIYRSVMVNGVWQGCTKLPEPINYPIGSSHYPCLSADGQHLFFGGVDLPLPSYGNLDIYDSRWVVGVEEPLSSTHLTPYATRLKVLPNPFTSFATLPGHEAERFSLYDVSGRKVGTNRGDRVGEGLAPGVYFLKYEEMLKQVQHDEIVRIVKVR